MNVSEILEQKRQRLWDINREIKSLVADLSFADCSSQINHHIYLLDHERREVEDVMRSLMFVGPMPTPEMKAEHTAEQWYKREYGRAMKRKALVDSVLGEWK